MSNKKRNGNGHGDAKKFPAKTKSKDNVKDGSSAEVKAIFAEYDAAEAELMEAEKLVLQARERMRASAERIYQQCGNETAFRWGNRTHPMILVVKPITEKKVDAEGRVTRVEVGKTFYFRGPQSRDVMEIGR